MVKMNQKGNKPPERLTCRFCANNLPETQEHLEMCEGTKFERRGVRISEVMGRVIFWRRRMKKMTQKTATVTSPEIHLPDNNNIFHMTCFILPVTDPIRMANMFLIGPK